MSFNQVAAKINTTDVATTGDGTEYVYGRKERTFTVDIFVSNLSGSSVPTLATSKALELSFEGRKYTGSGSFESANIVGSIDTAIKMSFAGSFDGAVVVTP
jgi:hypothetical protein